MHAWFHGKKYSRVQTRNCGSVFQTRDVDCSEVNITIAKILYSDVGSHIDRLSDPRCLDRLSDPRCSSALAFLEVVFGECNEQHGRCICLCWRWLLDVLSECFIEYCMREDWSLTQSWSCMCEGQYGRSMIASNKRKTRIFAVFVTRTTSTWI